MKPGPIALIDGNAFYASCEQVFQPALLGKPLVVLSNNDGAAIARTVEAKALGIKMAAPWFEIRHLQVSAGLMALSANFPLYGDMSDRMMNVISQFSSEQEIYSIDECFISLAGVRENLSEFGQTLRARVRQWVGIPTCVGIGHTYTQAKLGNHLAKKQAHWQGVCDLNSLSSENLMSLLKTIPVGEVWGIGRHLSIRLNAINIQTVFDLMQSDAYTLRTQFSVTVERIIRELRGQPCIDLGQEGVGRKQIAVTRSFGRDVLSIEELRESITEFVSRAAIKLRKQHSKSGSLYIFIRTSPFCFERPPYSAGIIVPLIVPSQNTITLTHAAVMGLNMIYRSGFHYAKAGVILMDLTAESFEQMMLFEDPVLRHDKKSQMMQAVDAINQRYGKGTLRLASAGIRPSWDTKRERLTPAYTTCWEEMLKVKAG